MYVAVTVSISQMWVARKFRNHLKVRRPPGLPKEDEEIEHVRG
jgi:hypothetical protein